MHWRPLRESDLLECLEVQAACMGDETVGRDAAVRIWRDLLASPAFKANVIEAEHPVVGHKIVGCGMGVFVDPEFVDRELATPRPGLNARIIASIAAGDSVVLDRDAIASGNAGGGLDFVNLYGTWRDDIIDTDTLAEVQMLLGTSFVEAFAGFRFNRVLKEAIGAARIELARATGTYRLVAEFPENDSALVVVTPESARSAPYSLANRMYRYQAPILHLRPAEQALLLAALDGKTDAELSTDLGLSVEAIKKRWMSVFARVDEFRPEILTSSDVDNTTRGPQKRHRVVAYVRAHLEELRPYAWTA
jgi:DNA-binding CsgD family transcriptional regulator